MPFTYKPGVIGLQRVCIYRRAFGKRILKEMWIVLGGYLGKVLRVNLTEGTITSETVSPAVLRVYIGGTGLGIFFLYNEVPAGVTPFSPDNRLVFCTGPLTGSGVPGSGNYSVVTRSPLSGFAVSAQSNGHFGAVLKKAGFDAIIFQGASLVPVYLYINNGQAFLQDAQEVWGKETFETETFLIEKHRIVGMPKPRVACIGPAGENMVLYAGIENEMGHLAASGGVGAVMGSKKLKAVVVLGNGRVPVNPGTQDEFRAAIRKWAGDAKEGGLGATVDRLGSAGLFEAYYQNGWVPVKNLAETKFPAHERFDGVYLRQNFPGKRNSCYACPMDHCRRMTIPNGKYAGMVVEEPEYEDLAGWGSNVGNDDPAAAFYLTDLTDRLGLDLKEATFLVSLLMECYEKGLLTAKDLDGLQLDWGNIEAIAELLKRIAGLEGVGEHLAGGVVKAARWIGKEAPRFAVYVKRGYAPHVHDLRTKWGAIFTQAISQMGSQQGIDLTNKAAPDIGIDQPVGFSAEGIPRAEAMTGRKRQLEDCLGVCYFVCRGPGGLNHYIQALNALTGWDMSVEEALTVGERVINLLRLFNIRFGHTVDDDSVSPRLLEPPKDGPGAGKSLAPWFNQMRRTYYESMGWDPDSGHPLPETLDRLGIKL
ncbi:hypothetical protein SY88_17590 [Clostridiales bacterium PH28_bin88]|nr:hypothetical protein SY88_17590 [Clostridiales bacterium PH28_bin88]